MRVSKLQGTSSTVDRDLAAVLAKVEQFQRALQRRDRAEIADRLRDLVAARTPMAAQWLQLARIAADLGEIGLARQAIDLYVESFDGSAAAQFTKAGFLTYFGAFDEALALLATLPPGVPDPFSYALSRGAAALNTGDAEQARAWLEEATRRGPRSGTAWHSLSQLVNFDREPRLFDRIVAGARTLDNAPPMERALYHYALGKALADRGAHAEAFAAIARAAGETKALFPDDEALDRQSALEAMRGYDPARIAAIARQQTEPTGRSIFVMGLPRSGTTLVEQVLTSHSEVTYGAELNLLRLLVHQIGDASYPALENHVRTAGAPSLAQLWHHLLDERVPRPGRVVDKTTDTTRKLGVAAGALPEAPLIWLKRDPLDCAWSCFRTCFMQGIRWSNDLTDVAAYFRLEDQLLSQWRQILGEALLVMPYEELVTDPEPAIRRLLAHCGLAEEPQAFAPHENVRAIGTASMMQVRRPINREGIGAAEPYREFLRPFIDAYYG
jgi:tetratricopeptide (TPR) repeat protein